jgi:NAD(P)H-flavin reductase
LKALAAPWSSTRPTGRVAVVRGITQETPDTTTYRLTFPDPHDRASYDFLPGQFNMLYVFGVGEVPISIASRPGALPLFHTIRHTGRVTDAFSTLSNGDEIVVRGPFGRPWPMEAARERDLLVVAGGLGLAPVRPAILDALRERSAYRRVILVVGARSPEHMLYRRELETWTRWASDGRIDVHLTVDVPTDGWPFHEGVVTTLFDRLDLHPEVTTAFLCGPEIMMHFASGGLLERGIHPSQMFLSMERNMQCGARICGHCQFGAHFVCSEGPVFSYEEIAGDLKVAEL